MEPGLYKQLWRIRFQKMLNLERQSVRDYGSLLKSRELKYREDQVRGELKKLYQDEKKHMRLVKELIEILDRQKVTLRQGNL